MIKYQSNPLNQRPEGSGEILIDVLLVLLMNNNGHTLATRILVVDDEPRILRFVSLSLSSQGFDVAVASSGEEGLVKAKSHDPDIMILDILMPGMDGLAVLQCLRTNEQREARTRLPVIICSARSSLAEEAVSLGADDFVVKPFLPDELADKVRAVLGKSKR
jgi:DNA-binding response OmpR family regulator